MQATDRELLDQWRDGDKEAGNALFKRHFESIRRFFRNKTDLKETEDLIQRTFLACAESAHGYRGEGSFRAYLFVIARRQLIDHIHRKTRDEGRAEPDLTVASIADIGFSPSAIVAKLQEHEIIAEAMRRIPVDFQITLELYYWEQLRGAELAAVLGVAPATVRTRLHRAREAMRAALATLRTDGVESDVEDSVSALGAHL